MRAGSYRVIRPGMAVIGPERERIGRVAEVLVDDSSGIFAGLVVERGWLAPRLRVPGEHILTVEEGEVRVALPGSNYPRYQPPAQRHPPSKAFTER